MNNTVTRSKELSAEEVCSILKACGEAQVSVLKFRNLYVKFGGPAEHQKNDLATVSPIIPETEISEQASNVSTEALLKEARLTKEERLALLQIEDPHEYEKLLFSGELEDDKTGEMTDGESQDY